MTWLDRVYALLSTWDATCATDACTHCGNQGSSGIESFFVVSHGTCHKVSCEKCTTVTKQTLSTEQKAWLGALEWCESRGNPKAINPKDRDNTPSYGLLQFKPSTFEYFAEKYGIATTSKGYMDPDVQEAIVTQMILQGHVDWSWQFPMCTKRLGPPPA